jgi:putative protease
MSLRRKPELLAPAGDPDCLRAAIENGADAVYFGLAAGFNARARATNFSVEELPELMQMLHHRGVKGYITLNTLVFPSELPAIEEHIRAVAAAGADAVLVQDLGVARLIRAICPDLSIHASTQMTLTSAESIRFAEELGVERVVLARELSLDEIRKIHSQTNMPLEAFAHGALCVAYSGQCLTSESLGGRSANRGQCAQACRLPYDLTCDGKDVELGDVKYLLSPQDLAAYDLAPEMIDAGVISLKIEGRLKTPEYVANITRHYRQAIDAAFAGERVAFSRDDVAEMELSFSRGFSHGWLEGCNHKVLVEGTSSDKRGVRLGSVVSVERERVVVELASSLKRGDGVAFQTGEAEASESGGRVYEIFVDRRSVEAAESGRVALAFKRGFDLSKIRAGQTVWKTDDPELTARLRKTFTNADPIRRVPIDLEVVAKVGEPLRVIISPPRGSPPWSADLSATADSKTPSDSLPSGEQSSPEETRVCALSEASTVADHSALHGGKPRGGELVILSESPLAEATKHPLTEETLREQFGRLGGTAFELRSLTASIAGRPMIPFSQLGKLRHELVRRLDEAMQAPPPRRIAPPGVLASFAIPKENSANAESTLRVLCRSLAQLRLLLERGVPELYADFQDIREYREAVQLAHAAGARLYLATPRIQKPDEVGIFRAMAKHGADGILVRNLGGLLFFHEQQLPLVADFSLNCTNHITAQLLREKGVERITPSYDLNRDQLHDLVAAVPPSWLEVVIHQHMPMFHMEHCVFCAVLSPGTNKTNCGRPCDVHDVKLRDRLGVEHPLKADVGCRNTLFNAVPQSAAEAVPSLLAQGLRDFRLELLSDPAPHELDALLSLYRDLLAGRITGKEVWTRLKAANRVGVTRGTLEERRNPLAIL